MGTKTINVHIIHGDTKTQKGNMLGKPFVAFDFNPNSPRSPMLGFAPDTKELAKKLAATFQYMADNCYKKEKLSVKRRAATKKKKGATASKVRTRRTAVKPTKKTTVKTARRER